MPTHTEYRQEVDRLRAANKNLVEACRAALDWLGECDEGTHQAEIANELRAAIAFARRQGQQA